MSLIVARPTNPGRRHLTLRSQKLRSRPEKRLLRGIVQRTAGRNSSGRITVRHRGGGEKRKLRVIDWERGKDGISGKVERIEYDPNRSAFIALIVYPDGDKRYIIAPSGLTIGQVVLSGKDAPKEPGNCLLLRDIPIGMPIHNLELRPGKGGQIVRSAGQAAFIQAKEEKYVNVKLPSGELRRFDSASRASIGQVSNAVHQSEKLGKAGRRRHMGWRPEVRGTAMNPRSHPHGGGEGRSGIGMKSPKSPWGKRTMGKKTRRRTYSDRWILSNRRIKE